MVLGVCRFPALDEVVYAAEGQGAWWQIGNGHAAAGPRLAGRSALRGAVLRHDDQRLGADRPLRRIREVCAAAKLTRGWGDCYGHALVATGRADVMVDPLMNPWDAAALVPIVQEAGGHFSTGRRPSIYSGNGVSVNAALKDTVLDMLHPD